MSKKGQITIPKALRERLGLRAGQVLEMFEERGRLVARKIGSQDAFDRMYGVLELGGPTDSVLQVLRRSVDGP